MFQCTASQCSHAPGINMYTLVLKQIMFSVTKEASESQINLNLKLTFKKFAISESICSVLFQPGSWITVSLAATSAVKVEQKRRNASQQHKRKDNQQALNRT